MPPLPFLGSMPKLDYVMKGIKRTETQKGSGARPKLPITLSILSKLKLVWERRVNEHDIKMVWAACSLSFFALLKVGELTIPSDTSYDLKVHLSVADIAVDNPGNLSFMQITIKQSKTDPFRKGVNLFVGRSDSGICPVAAVLWYLEKRQTTMGPLFRFQDGRHLT